MSFTVWDVQSLQNKAGEVMEHILDLSSDLTFCTETWLTSQNNDVTGFISDYGYKLYHQIRCSDVKSRGGGVRIIAHSSHKLTRVKSSTFESFEHCIYSVKKKKQEKLF